MNISKKQLIYRSAIVSGIVGALIALRVGSAQTSWQQVLPNWLQDLVTISLSIIIEALPFVLLGIGVAVLIRVWLPSGVIFKYLPHRPLLRRACVSLYGMFLPVCECGNVPVARTLLSKGLDKSDSLVFLLSAPILNPITILTTQQAFVNDPAIVVARVIGGFIIANTIGWIFARHSDKQLLRSEFIAYCHTEHNHTTNKCMASLLFVKQEVIAMMPALLFGAFCAGIIQTVVPRDILLGLGSDPVLSVVAMVVLAFVVSICSNVDSFFALAFRNTFTTGSLVSFLTFGPMIDVKMLSLMRTTYRPIVLWQISLCVALMSVTLGLVVNYVF